MGTGALGPHFLHGTAVTRLSTGSTVLVLILAVTSSLHSNGAHASPTELGTPTLPRQLQLTSAPGSATTSATTAAGIPVDATPNQAPALATARAAVSPSQNSNGQISREVAHTASTATSQHVGQTAVPAPHPAPLASANESTTAQALTPRPAHKAMSACVSRKQTLQQTPPVECYLKIDGHGRAQAGIKSLKLNCSSPTDSAYKLPIGVATGLPANPISKSIAEVIVQELERNAQGVIWSGPDRPVHCQTEAEAFSASETASETRNRTAVPLYALLYLCNGNVRFVRPVIQNVWLPYPKSEDTAVIAFGGEVQASILEAVIQGNDASTVFAVFGSAELTISQSQFQGNFGNPGSGVFAQSNAVVTVAESNFVNNNSSDYGGAIAAIRCSSLNSTSNNFTNNSALFGGGAISGSDNVTLVILRNKILSNQAAVGGGIYYNGGASVSISTTLISNNTATEEGGGINILNTVTPGSLVAAHQLFLSPNSKITQNKAGSGGGATIGSNVAFDASIARDIITGNTAAYDDDISTEPTALTVVGSPYISNYVGRPAEDEGLLPVHLLLTGNNGTFPCAGQRIEAYWLVASIGQAALPTSLFDCRRSEAPLLPQALALSSANGSVQFNLKFQQPPGNHTIAFVYDAGATCPPVMANITVNVRTCVRGELQVKPGVCSLCPKDKYSFDSNVDCIPCPDHATCPGGSVVVSKPGYWQSSLNSTQIHRCPHPEACMGNRSRFISACRDSDWAFCNDSVFVDGQCGQPAGLQLSVTSQYQGPLCGTCAAGCGTTKPFQCTPCMQKASIGVLYVVAGMATLLYIALLCHFTLADCQKQARTCQQSLIPEGLQRPQVLVNTLSQNATIKPSHLLRQLILHAQYTLIIASVRVGEAWPGSLSWALKLLAIMWATASPETLAPDCLRSASQKLPIAIERILFYLGTPLAMMLLLLAAQGTLAYVAHDNAREVGDFMRHRLLATTLVVGFFFLPSVAGTAFSLFVCVEVDKPWIADMPSSLPKAVGWLWVHDLDQVCWSSSGWQQKLALGLGIPLCALIAAVPVVILLVTLTQRKRGGLENPRFVENFNFLVQYYKPEYCFWEAVVSIQTISLVAVSVFGYSLGPTLQALVMNVVVLSCGICMIVAQPLAHLQAMKVAVASMACLFLTSYTALTFAQYGTDANQEEIPVYMGALVLVVNLMFIGWVLWQLVCIIHWKVVWLSAVKGCTMLATCNCRSCRFSLANHTTTSGSSSYPTARAESVPPDASYDVNAAAVAKAASTDVASSSDTLVHIDQGASSCSRQT